MKILLVALNTKYIHSNLAVYNLKESAASSDAKILIKEYTINQYVRDILIDLYEEKADILAFSCYIWNISMVHDIIDEIKKIQPGIKIWVGGPEVSYDVKEQLETHKGIDIVMSGEGERTFLALVNRMEGGQSIEDVEGIAYRKEGQIILHPRTTFDYIPMDEVPFVYKDMKDFEHKIIYYETSRGCPYSCSYCLSSIDKRVRLRSLEKVYQELQFFLDQKVPQVKFVDRTFNCNKEHSLGIWKYIAEHDNGITNFHFEVSEDLLGEEEFLLFETMRPGLIQLEIGVQSTHEKTIREIKRTMNLARLRDNVARIKKMKNIHQHLDLIAGLPYEDFSRFQQSFNEVYDMRPDQLQLGFLKVLKGSYMYEMQDEYGVIASTMPPYEVMATKWISYDHIIVLKGVEEMVEVYYNSGQFSHTMEFFMSQFESAFQLYYQLYLYYKKNEYLACKHTRLARYEILREFAKEREFDSEAERTLDEYLILDMYEKEPMKKRPEWASSDSKMKREYQCLLKRKDTVGELLSQMKPVGRSEMTSIDKAIERLKELEQYPHVEFVEEGLLKTLDCEEKGPGYLLFNYAKRDPLSGNATLYYIAEKEWEELL